MVDLAARYTLAVRRYLPKHQADDIAAELSDSIESQIEDESARLGRPLSVEEEAALIKSHGHPLLAASHYWPQQALIGPALLPFWWQTLKTALIVLLSINIAIDLIVVVAGQNAPASFEIFWGTVWGTTVFTFAIVTGVFALFERFGLDVTTNWDPRTLPSPQSREVPRIQSAIELFFNGGFALWLGGFATIRALADATPLGSGIHYIAGLPFRLSWLHVYVLVLLIAATAQAAVNVINLLRPDWDRLRAAVYACANAAVFIVAVLTLVLNLHTLVVPGIGSSQVIGDVARLAMILNWTAATILAGVAVGCGIVTVTNVLRLLPGRAAVLPLGSNAS